MYMHGKNQALFFPDKMRIRIAGASGNVIGKGIIFGTMCRANEDLFYFYEIIELIK